MHLCASACVNTCTDRDIKCLSQSFILFEAGSLTLKAHGLIVKKVPFLELLCR